MTQFYAVRDDGFSFKTLRFGKRDLLRMAVKLGLEDDLLDDLLEFSQKNVAMLPWWKAPEIRFIENAEVSKPKMPDVSLWAAGAALVLSPKAKRILGDILGKYGELLPVENVDDGDTYWIFNCLKNSNVVEAESAWEFQGEIPISLTALKIPESSLSLAIFKVPYQGCTTLYCSDYLKDVINEYELKGLYFDDNLVEPLSQR